MREGNWEIYVVNADGSQVVNITRASGTDFNPAWAPDGEKLAFASNRSGAFQIHVSNADGANPRNLTDSPELDLRPTWAPDGNRIAFESNRQGPRDIFILDLESGEYGRGSWDTAPAWAPLIPSTLVELQSWGWVKLIQLRR